MDSQNMTTKKALTVLLMLVFLIGLTLIVPSSWVGVQKTKRTPLILRNNEELKALSGDNDRNNIPDWQDMLLESVSSSTEAEAKNTTINKELEARLNDPNNLTASISKNMYMVGAYTKKNGAMTKEEQDALMVKMIGEESSKIETKIYEISELRIAKTATTASKKEYGNALGLLLVQADAYKLGTNDLAILTAYNTSRDASVLEGLIVKKGSVERIIKKMLELSVPPSAAPYHLLMLNRLSVYKTVLENMAQAETDPIRATLAFNTHQTAVIAILSSLGALQHYLVDEGVVFTKNEPGYTFVQGILK